VVRQQVAALSRAPPDPAAAAALTASLSPPAVAGAWCQARLLAGRGFAAYARNPSGVISRLLVTVAISLIVGSIEWGKGK
jgi:hypothetical protein